MEFPTDRPFDIKDHTILYGLAGSRAYGTNMPESDWDYRGVLIPPPKYFWSPFKNFEQTSWKSEELSGRVSAQTGQAEKEAEATVFSIDKFFSLAIKCNPNVLEILFLENDQYLIETPAGAKLRNYKNLFLTQRALYTFTGYAISQLKRIKTHKGWIDNPPAKRPERTDFGLPPEKLVSGDTLGAADKFIRRNLIRFAPWLEHARNDEKEVFWEGVQKIVGLMGDNWQDIENQALSQTAESLGFDTNFTEYLKSEKQYSQALRHYDQYQAWKRNRNPARAELEARYGYDCKHAMHLVRLIRMGREILTQGTLRVYRPDAQELREIRNGSWPYDQLISWSETEVESLYDLVRDNKAVVPRKPDQNKIENLYLEIIEEQIWQSQKTIINLSRI